MLCIHPVYTGVKKKMKDLFDASILCNECNIKTRKNSINKEGFEIRYSECPRCNEKWYHPTDMKEYGEFKKLRNREFHVKLRMVGNSFSVTIPKEIIAFEEKFTQMEKEMDRMMKLSLEKPGRLRLCFKDLLEE